NNGQDLLTAGNIILEKLAKYIDDSQAGQGPVLIQQPMAQLVDQLDLQNLIRNGGLDVDHLDGFMDTYLKNTIHLQHPGYIGHQVSIPHMAAGLADMINGVTNNPMAIYEMGPVGASIEYVVLQWMLEKVGWPMGADGGAGVLTHGGSLANLTALLGARAAIAPNAWEDGTPNDLVVLAPECAHYSIARAISIIGLGSHAILPVATNEYEVLLPDALSTAYRQATANGKQVMAVVANACATSTGLYDPLDEIGDFCQEEGLWLHVDSPHGATAILSEEKKHLLEGLEKANSMTWDAHKMMRTTTLCTAVLFRDQEAFSHVFQQKASYLFHDKEQPGVDFIPYSVECTKAGLGLKLFMVLATLGENGLGEYVEELSDKTLQFYQIIEARSCFSCLCTPQLNILCLRYKDESDNFQLELRNQLVNEGHYYITSAEVKGARYLRLAVMNPLTEASHIEGLLDALERIAAKMTTQVN
ncbi:MAG: pyridoxal phosphate-dependent decarboxylase family protein, partial [Cyclobacteriaceae bacterium]